VKIRSAVWPTKAGIKKNIKKHRQNITWTHRWACVHNKKVRYRWQTALYAFVCENWRGWPKKNTPIPMLPCQIWSFYDVKIKGCGLKYGRNPEIREQCRA